MGNLLGGDRFVPPKPHSTSHLIIWSCVSAPVFSKYMKYFLSIFICILLLVPSVSLAEVIQSFDVKMNIREDRVVEVIETITYDFEDESGSRRGIFREIPTQDVSIRIIEVLQNGEEAVTREGREGGYVSVRVGEEDVFVEGVQEYVFRYEVKGLVERLERQELDEVYWQVTGTEWEVPIEQASFQVNFPVDLKEKVGEKADLFQFACYVGQTDSTSGDCSRNWVESNVYRASIDRQLNPGEGFTIAVGFPMGIAGEPSFWEKYREIVDVVVAVVMILIAAPLWLWAYRKYARDPKLRRPFPVQYDAPEGMSPAGVVRMKKKVQSSEEVVATLISLAEQRYLKIEETQEKGLFTSQVYEFHSQKKDTSNLKEFEKILFEKLFQGAEQVDTKELEKNRFGDRLTQFYTKVYEEEIGAKSYYTRAPMGSSAAVVVMGVLIGFGIIPLVILGLTYSIFSLVILVIMTLVLAALMPQRTEEGTRVLEHILGLERYIDVAEKHRLEFQEKQQIFFEILPYAIALGKAKVWAKAFEGIITETPDWYSSRSGQAFSAITFTDSISNGIASSSASGSSASSGGGSVGGGAGGGGGGSW